MITSCTKKDTLSYSMLVLNTKTIVNISHSASSSLQETVLVGLFYKRMQSRDITTYNFDGLWSTVTDVPTNTD